MNAKVSMEEILAGDVEIDPVKRAENKINKEASMKAFAEKRISDRLSDIKKDSIDSTSFAVVKQQLKEKKEAEQKAKDDVKNKRGKASSGVDLPKADEIMSKDVMDERKAKLKSDFALRFGKKEPPAPVKREEMSGDASEAPMEQPTAEPDEGAPLPMPMDPLTPVPSPRSTPQPSPELSSTTILLGNVNLVNPADSSNPTNMGELRLIPPGTLAPPPHMMKRNNDADGNPLRTLPPMPPYVPPPPPPPPPQSAPYVEPQPYVQTEPNPPFIPPYSSELYDNSAPLIDVQKINDEIYDSDDDDYSEIHPEKFTYEELKNYPTLESFQGQRKGPRKESILIPEDENKLAELVFETMAPNKTDDEISILRDKTNELVEDLKEEYKEEYREVTGSENAEIVDIAIDKILEEKAMQSIRIHDENVGYQSYEHATSSIGSLLHYIMKLSNKMIRLVKLKRLQWKTNIRNMDLQVVYYKVVEYYVKFKELDPNSKVMIAYRDSYNLCLKHIDELNDEFNVLIKTSSVTQIGRGGRRIQREKFTGESNRIKYK